MRAPRGSGDREDHDNGFADPQAPRTQEGRRAGPPAHLLRPARSLPHHSQGLRAAHDTDPAPLERLTGRRHGRRCPCDGSRCAHPDRLRWSRRGPRSPLPQRRAALDPIPSRSPQPRQTKLPRGESSHASAAILQDSVLPERRRGILLFRRPGARKQARQRLPGPHAPALQRGPDPRVPAPQRAQGRHRPAPRDDSLSTQPARARLPTGPAQYDLRGSPHHRRRSKRRARGTVGRPVRTLREQVAQARRRQEHPDSRAQNPAHDPPGLAGLALRIQDMVGVLDGKMDAQIPRRPPRHGIALRGTHARPVEAGLPHRDLPGAPRG